jgi:hypothetical protein
VTCNEPCAGESTYEGEAFLEAVRRNELLLCKVLHRDSHPEQEVRALLTPKELKEQTPAFWAQRLATGPPLTSRAFHFSVQHSTLQILARMRVTCCGFVVQVRVAAVVKDLQTLQQILLASMADRQWSALLCVARPISAQDQRLRERRRLRFLLVSDALCKRLQ